MDHSREAEQERTGASRAFVAAGRQCLEATTDERSEKGEEGGHRPGDSRRSRISPGRRSNSTRRGGGVASREGGVRAAPRCCLPTVISLWYSSLFDDNRLQTPALSALCEGEGLRTIVLRTSVYANPTNGFNISYRPLDRAARCHPRASPSGTPRTRTLLGAHSRPIEWLAREFKG